jgi:hypothetical protein
MGYPQRQVQWEVDDAAPTRVKQDPPPSELEVTRIWREDSSGVRVAELADFSPSEADATLAFHLERRLPPSHAITWVDEALEQTRPAPLLGGPVAAAGPPTAALSPALIAVLSAGALLFGMAVPFVFTRLF